MKYLTPGVRHPFRQGSHLDHLEVLLAGSAFRAGPVHGHIGPGRSRWNAVVRCTCRLVVDPATNQTHPSFRFTHSLRGLRIECKYCIETAPAIRARRTATHRILPDDLRGATPKHHVRSNRIRGGCRNAGHTLRTCIQRQRPQWRRWTGRRYRCDRVGGRARTSRCDRRLRTRYRRDPSVRVYQKNLYMSIAPAFQSVFKSAREKSGNSPKI